MKNDNLEEQRIQTYLNQAKTIAIVGLSDKSERTSYQIAQYLQTQGYRIFPVNPLLSGQKILGELVYPSLKDILEKIDIVDIFRQAKFLPEIAQEFLTIDARVFWAQLGIENEEAAEILKKAGHDAVVMNRCIKIEIEKRH